MRILIAPSLFLVLPFAEIATFVLVGNEIGVGMTLMLVLASMVAGIVLLRFQGLGTLRRLQQATAGGGDPGRELVHGVMIVVAGILLILPGFLSDIVGILLFLPPVRDLAWKVMRDRLNIVTVGSGFGFSPGSRPGDNSSDVHRRGPQVVDLEEDEYSRDAPRSPGQQDDRNRLR
ncbi:UPF0716 protein FxsA [Pararhizobium capsulatum DSM 1112]|uniref:UPF0716 protein FxsA n=1 Tax=Pararhizobium capsulatum DSM 1112 TaxID=1121113 RepID=A0ABU0BMW2_9HYPH|nr:FxsA family protein [Pararhizobium capsulatum]MDQ0318217.1 UPF0716 protein FxsA [Pararhizobium capsulatum DSM 1112]